MKRVYRKTAYFALAVVCITAVSTLSHASGFNITEKGVKGMGNAYAGGAASAEDASTVFFNPAGLTRLSERQLVFAPQLIAVSFNFADRGSTTILGQSLAGGDGGDGGTSAFVPNVYYAQGLTEKLRIGIGIFTPFGLSTEYDPGWKGRYHAITSKVVTLEINPVVAYRINRRWSIGVGISAQYLDAELSNAIDYGTINAVLGLGLPIAPQGADGRVTLTGDDWAFGFNLGLLLELNDKTRFGWAYRSRISHGLAGDAAYTTPPAAAPIAASLGLVNTGGDTDIDLPDHVSVSAYHQINHHWAVMADISWMKWRELDEFRVRFANGAADSVLTFNWEDTFRYALGATYAADERWTYRVGVSFDETPVPDATHRSPRIPDEERYWLSLGTSCQLSKHVGLDFGYIYLRAHEATIDKAAAGEDLFRGALKGSFDGNAHIIGSQIQWQF